MGKRKKKARKWRESLSPILISDLSWMEATAGDVAVAVAATDGVGA